MTKCPHAQIFPGLPNDCEHCKKTFKTLQGLKGHVTKKDKSYLEISNEPINLSSTETEKLFNLFCPGGGGQIDPYFL